MPPDDLSADRGGVNGPSPVAGDATAPRPKRLPPATAPLQMLPEFIHAMLYRGEVTRAEHMRKMVEALEPRSPALAKRVRRMIPNQMSPIPTMPSSLLDCSTPRFGLDGVVMSRAVRRELDALVSEHGRADELLAYGLNPRNRVLLFGPPGNGKTMIAEALAKELDLPFMTAAYGGLIDSHLGVTGRNIATLFQYVNAVPCVLFLDEFDAVGAARSDGSDVREFRRVTNQLLLVLDRLSPRCVLVAATNEDSLIDAALKRRFDMPLCIAKPDAALKLECALLELDPKLTPGRDMRSLAERVAGGPAGSLDDVTKICRKLRRDAVLNDGRGAESILGGVPQYASGNVA